MIYMAIYRNERNAAVKEVLFDARDLTQALEIVCTTQTCPEEATQISVEPAEPRRAAP